MKLPSIDRLVTSAVATARRFPATVTCAVIAAMAAMMGVGSGSENDWWRLMVSASLGLPLFTGITLQSERRQSPASGVWVARAAGLAVLLLFYWRWSAWSEPTALLRYFHLSATLHLAVAVVAYVGIREPNGLWQFNRALFLRFLIGGVYSGVLFAGLAIALAGIDNLLGFSIDGDNYFRLFVFIGFVFQTWFFLAGVPDDFQSLERCQDYPTGLRVFSQYVLLPLVSVYLMILSAYLVRILVTRTWPSGWIGYLVSALAALGILSLLLIHPERGRAGQRWIDRYARLFWVAILPPVAMLLLAVWQRIDQYGITERRYLLAVLALWLAGVALYYALTRSRGIKPIPLSLGLVAGAAFLGPWSAYSVAESSQVARLAELLETHGVLVDGLAVPARTEIPADDWRGVSDVLRYLAEYHGTQRIDEWFEGGLGAIDTIGEGAPRWQAGQRAALILDHLGLVPTGGLPVGPGGDTYLSVEEYEPVFPVAGYEFLIHNADLAGGRHQVGGDTVEFDVVEDRAVSVRRNGVEILQISLLPLLDRGLRGSGTSADGRIRFPQASMQLEATNDRASIRIQVGQVHLRRAEDGSLLVVGATGTVLLRWEPANEKNPVENP